MKNLPINYDVYRPIYERTKSQGKSELESIEEMADYYLEEHSYSPSYESAFNISAKLYQNFENEVEVVKLLQKGMSQKEIEIETGLDANKVRRYARHAREIGVQVVIKNRCRQSRGGLMSKKDEVIKMLKEGKSNTEIAATLGIYKGNVSQFRNTLRKQEIEQFGHTDIPTGKEVAEEVVYTKPVGRPTLEQAVSSEHTQSVLNITKEEAEEYEERMKNLTPDEKEQLELDLEAYCNTLINSDMPLEEIYEKHHNKDWYSKVNMTMSYLENLTYGGTLAWFKRNVDVEDVVYYLDGDRICYDYNDCVDHKGNQYTKKHSRQITKEVTDILLDINGEPKKLLFEGVMVSLNGYIRTGKFEEPTKNKYIRRISYKNGLADKLKEVAAAA